jgi:hypothetical protein
MKQAGGSQITMKAIPAYKDTRIQFPFTTDGKEQRGGSQITPKVIPAYKDTRIQFPFTADGKEQRGGSQITPKVIPAYKDTRINNPFMTNDQRDIYKKEKDQKDQKAANQQPPPSLFEFKLNDRVFTFPEQRPPQPDAMKQLIDQGIYPQPFVPVANPFHPIPGPLIPANGPYAYMANQVPIIKKYNISMSNVNGDLVRLSNLFEDVLPQINGITQKTLTTLSERKIIYQYLRALFIRHSDGEDIRIGGKNDHTSRTEMTNLLSHVKLMEINPYHFSRLTNNPYKTLPNNFLMFRSCYPIRLLTSSNTVQCAQDNIGLHIRIYQMKIIDILANRLGTNLTKKDSDLWREIAYYEYIRENILRQNVCPNFVLMYAWYMTYKSGVDFEKLSKLKSDKNANQITAKDNSDVLLNTLKRQIYGILSEGDNIYGTIRDLDKIVAQPIDPTLPDDVKKEKAEEIKKATEARYRLLVDLHENNNPDQTALEIFNYFNTNVIQTKRDHNNIMAISELEKIDVRLPTNKCIVSLTEAPTHNLYDWGTRAYNMELGPIRKMIHTGFHDIKVWQSVIFQLFAGLYTMYINKIAINELSIQNNIYIKDLHRDENNIGYWKYIIKGIDFYVPNMGYLVLIDSKYQELEGGLETTEFQAIKPLRYKHRIYGEMFDDKVEDVDTLNITNMINIFSPNNFVSQEFTQYGGLKPPVEVINTLNIMTNILNMYKTDLADAVKKNTTVPDFDKTITDLLIRTQYHLLHNKIGTLVKDVEKDQLIDDNISFKHGELVAHKITGTKDDAFTWALYLENDGQTHRILTTDHVLMPDNKVPKLTIKNVSQGDILRTYGVVEQNYKPNQKLAEEDVLETYTINL